MNPASHPDRACRDEDTEIFFPHPSEIAEARLVINTFCARCPVITECLEEALRVEGSDGHSGRAGIYGGTTPRQRYAIYRSRRNTPSQVEPKTCPQCQTEYHPTLGEKPGNWARRMFCSRSCANRASNAARREARSVA